MNLIQLQRSANLLDQRQVYARATLTNSIGNTKIMFNVSVNHQHAHAV